MITKIPVDKMNLIAPLFDGWDETMIWSCLQGCMGHAWADRTDHPRAAQIVVGDFCVFAGDASIAQAKELAFHIPENHPHDFLFMIPQDESWCRVIEEVNEGRYEKFMRYALKKEPGVFDRNALEAYITALPEGYSIMAIDESLYHSTKNESWSEDFCSLFPSYNDYKAHGLGYVAIYEGNPVSGASSYAYYNEGIEIEIATAQVHRRKGLATACAAKLILESLDRGLYPSWDAANKASLALAEKLGYQFDREYVAYEVTR